MTKKAKTLMVLGSMSAVGKSLLVTGLCRLYARRGIRVAPFKAQNISNNAAVCADGAEIGRAQYTQALACNLEPEPRMNPVLIKPEAGGRAQIIVMGRTYASLPVAEQQDQNVALWEVVKDALNGLRHDYDLLIMEGAGSPAEINLQSDIVNMAVARYTQSPVLLVGDIDRGGIFAQLLGTLWLLPPEDRGLVKGLVVNKFRGDLDLFREGVTMLEEKSALPVVGVVPYIHHAIPEEDAVAIEDPVERDTDDQEIEIVVVRLPGISNFDDFDALQAEIGVRVRFADSPDQVGRAQAVILLGSKNTMADMAWLTQRGWPQVLRTYAAAGGAVVGICGGYQLLGETIHDPHGVESAVKETQGLGLLPLDTIFHGEKSTHQVRAAVLGGMDWLNSIRGILIEGYEIHMGETRRRGGEGWLELTRRGRELDSVLDGATSNNGRIWGCYLHGLFNNSPLRRAWLGSLGWQGQNNPQPMSLEIALDRWADHVEAGLDMETLDRLVEF